MHQEDSNMNCFVIMPFAKEFDDVYTAIKTNVEAVISFQGGRCYRLDETRPAGPITDRLLREIQETAFCVADVTGNIPNVMWEVGYAMALGKPIILITQKISELPFDIKDLQGLEYDRNQISRTLGEPLRKIVTDTTQIISKSQVDKNSKKGNEELVETLLTEIQGLKSMIGNMVKVWEPPVEKIEIVLQASSIFQGAWIDREERTHVYAKIINGELIAPYCFGGNESLTGVFFDWKMAGDYWYTKFAWLKVDIAGFAFLKQVDSDTLTGAWWGEEQPESKQNMPPEHTGTSIRLERHSELDYPEWALQFFDKVQKLGLATVLAKSKVFLHSE